MSTNTTSAADTDRIITQGPPPSAANAAEPGKQIESTIHHTNKRQPSTRKQYTAIGAAAAASDVTTSQIAATPAPKRQCTKATPKAPPPPPPRTTSTKFQAAAQAGASAAFSPEYAAASLPLFCLGQQPSQSQSSQSPPPVDDKSAAVMKMMMMMDETTEHTFLPQTPLSPLTRSSSITSITTTAMDGNMYYSSSSASKMINNVSTFAFATTPSAPTKATSTTRIMTAAHVNSLALPEGDLVSRHSAWTNSFEQQQQRRSPFLENTSFDNDNDSQAASPYDFAEALGYHYNSQDSPLCNPFPLPNYSITAANTGSNNEEDENEEGSSYDLANSLLQGMLIESPPTLGSYHPSPTPPRRVSLEDTFAGGGSITFGEQQHEPQPPRPLQEIAASYNMGQPGRGFCYNNKKKHHHLQSLRVDLEQKYDNDVVVSSISPKTIQKALDAAFAAEEEENATAAL